MILDRLQRETTITRLRATPGVDSYGDPVAEDWSQPDRLVLRRAEVQAVNADETETAAGSTTVDERVLYALGRPDVREGDRIEVGSEVWRVDGPPIVRQGLASGRFLTASLRRVSGR